ncbi:MAG TPA: hypothetical protein VIT89_02665 [Solirubrobacterales bacterium]
MENAISSRDAQILELGRTTDSQRETIVEMEGETTTLAGMVFEREREIRVRDERLREANETHDRSIASLDAITARLEELEAQARGQATRIRMKALREAVEVSKKVKALTDVDPAYQTESQAQMEADSAEPDEADDALYAGRVKLEIGPLGDFAQLVGFEDAVGQIGASEISVERFSEGRATFSMNLDQPVDLLRELEELSNVEFKVRHNAPDNLILDVDEDQGEQRAA